MAVYERTYESYSGPQTPEWARFLVVPSYAFREVFQSRLFVAFLAACYVWPLVLAILIYLPHNLGFLEFIGANADELLAFFKYDAGWFFKWFMVPYIFVSFAVTFFVAPPLISTDLRDNGLPLYLARPFSRAEYVAGKMTVLIVLLSAITWIPGVLLFLFRSYLGGWSWFVEHFRVGIAIVLSFWIWILILCLLGLAISAYVKWKPLARAALLLVFLAVDAMAELINALFQTTWGSIVSAADMIRIVWLGLFGLPGATEVPQWAAWASLLGLCGFCLLLLSRKVKAYEVVRS